MNKVDLNTVNSSQQASRSTETKQPAAEPRRVPVASESDHISVTNTAMQIQSMVERSSDQEPVRQDRVEALRMLIQNGEYQVSADTIAEAILRDEK